jgi:hypothetical protein
VSQYVFGRKNVDFITANKKLQDIWEKGERHHPFMIKILDAYHFFLHKQDADIPMYLFVSSLRKEKGNDKYSYVTDLLRPYEVVNGYDSFVMNREQLTKGCWRPNADGLWDATTASLYSYHEWEGFTIPIEVLGALSVCIQLLPKDEVASIYEMLRAMSGSGQKECAECLDEQLHPILQSFEYFNAAYVYAQTGLSCVSIKRAYMPP